MSTYHLQEQFVLRALEPSAAHGCGLPYLNYDYSFTAGGAHRKTHGAPLCWCTAGPRANGVLSIRFDRSTRPAASDARLTHRTKFYAQAQTGTQLTCSTYSFT
ncbi:hypothetical protein J7T55_007848 [Diaporthe amygdali]|uniref:uncharacterized protein n=1 Tax=Phomopsis amygdali TaxID=1214568 RepID=UPI0022FF088C|nr:uncharacterized protein J7T55_007848 [Diaporthe amygdali]KAJ0114014.1 hypothetical protein J7T55_007848 [Diaporthe amygdali]